MSVLEVYLLCAMAGAFGLLFLGSLLPVSPIRGPSDVMKLLVHSILFPLSWAMIVGITMMNISATVRRMRQTR